jgi:hypothetical protein
MSFHYVIDEQSIYFTTKKQQAAFKKAVKQFGGVSMTLIREEQK